MIVTCERCTTQFQLDDARVPDGGVRVRCSRCKHAFQVSPPASADEAPAPEPPAAESASTVIRDQPSDESAAVLARGNSASGPSDDEESDWQFNDDPPYSEDSEPVGTDAAASAVDALLGDPIAAPTVDAANVDPESAEANVAAPDVASPAFDATPSGLGEGPDLEIDSDPALDVAEPLSESLDIGETAAPAADVLVIPPDSDTSPLVSASDAADSEPLLDDISGDGLPSGGPGDELGATEEEWDLFGEARREADFGSESTPGTDALSVDLSKIDFDEGQPAWMTWASRVGTGVAWVGVAAAFAAGLYQGIAVPWQAANSSPSAVSVAGLSVESEGRWVDHVVAGPVYVVSGVVRNEGSTRRMMPALAVDLVDPNGGAVGTAAQHLTVERPEKDRREGPLTSAAKPLYSTRPLGPGDSRRFEVTLVSVPEAATQFRLVETERPASVTGSVPIAPVAETTPASKSGDAVSATSEPHSTASAPVVKGEPATPETQATAPTPRPTTESEALPAAPAPNPGPAAKAESS